MPASNDAPRHVSVENSMTKNDKCGTGPREGRTWLLACTCMESLTSEVSKKEFATSLRESPNCDCPLSCPYNVIKKYIHSCPDWSGLLREAEICSDPKLDPLRLFRAISSSGKNRRHLLTPFGELSSHLL